MPVLDALWVEPWPEYGLGQWQKGRKWSKESKDRGHESQHKFLF
jgi:hypothetical protein